MLCFYMDFDVKSLHNIFQLFVFFIKDNNLFSPFYNSISLQQEVLRL